MPCGVLFTRSSFETLIAMDEVRIERGRIPEDVGAIREIFAEYGESLGVDLSFQNFAEELRDLPEAYAEPAGVILVARRSDELVGCVALRPLGDGACEMKRLYVRASQRGSGLGRQLAVAVIDHARQLGYGVMRLDTMTSMKSAIRLYDALGFKRCAPYRAAGREDLIFFELDLSAAKSS
jgi:putative acetyltransferase